MTSWCEPDYAIDIEESELKARLSGYAIEVKIHRASKAYPLSGMVITKIACLWVNSLKSKITIGEPLEIEVLGCCDPMNLIEGEQYPITEYIGQRLKGQITHALKVIGQNSQHISHFLNRPTS
ncbi:hypothetical protein [Psychromonas sp. MME2]|uniref:hypothetical protein n=1 Tax=unclassified Psychromonas TaxID=2614957 RepID=UPI00339BE974